jgi:hypothetical protein
VPGQFGGIDFGDSLGSLEIESLLGGHLNFTLFAFPEQCSSVRYVTNLDPDLFTLEQKFGAQVTTPVCLWYTERSFILTLREVPEREGSMRVCRDENCQRIGKGATTFANLDFFMIGANDGHFLTDVQFNFEVKKMRVPLKISEILRSNAHTLIGLANQLWAEEIPRVIKQVFVYNNLAEVRRMRVYSTLESPMLLIALLPVTAVLTITAALTIASYCVHRARRKGRNQSETDLLISGDDPRRFPQYVYPSGCPAPPIAVTAGVYFLPAPDENSS